MASSSSLHNSIASMKRNLSKVEDRLIKQVSKALSIEANKIMRTSQSKFVPVDSGTLRDSGQVSEVARDNKGDLSVTLSYGSSGPSASYAVPVHENPSSYDPPSWVGKEVTFKPKGRGAKYLERPLNDAVDGMEQRLAERIKL